MMAENMISKSKEAQSMQAERSKPLSHSLSRDNAKIKHRS